MQDGSNVVDGLCAMKGSGAPVPSTLSALSCAARVSRGSRP